MTNEQIRIKIAELCGFKWYRWNAGRPFKYLALPEQIKYWDDCFKAIAQDGDKVANDTMLNKFIPNYPEDLNACHEMRRHLDTLALKVAFLNALREILARKLKRPISDFDLLDAEARDQCEAFLRAKGNP